jgi:hypothetical protein
MKKLCTLALSFALLALVACSDNLFGSSTPDKSDDVKSLRMDAENAFRKGDYKGSYDICAKIVAKDSTVSFGYFGMAKASLWMHGVNPLSVFSLVKSEEGKCPFMAKGVKVRNAYFQAMKNIDSLLVKLNKRDSLTDLYECYDTYYSRKTDKNRDEKLSDCKKHHVKDTLETLENRLSEFRNTFCGGSQDCKKPQDPVSGARFPLSDREYKSSYFGGILVLSSFSKWFLNFFDTNADGCITLEGKTCTALDSKGDCDNPGDVKKISEWEKWGCVKKPDREEFNYDLPLELECKTDSTGALSVVINTDKLLEQLEKKLETYYVNAANCNNATCDANNEVLDEIKNLNDKIDEFNGTFGEVEDVLNSLGLAGSSTTSDSTNLKDEIDKYRAYTSFFKMGTHIDEDGDGCIDEELLDGQDNDGDSLVNENSRLATKDIEHPLYGIASGKYGINSINNSMYGNNPYRDDNENWKYNKLDTFQHPMIICNNSICAKCKSGPAGCENSVYTEIPVDTAKGYVTVLGFTQIGYEDGSKYWTTKNLDTKLKVAQDTVCPPQFSLKFRQDSIGGCWPYYNEDKFVKYWLKRGLAPGTNRVDESCRRCVGAGCLR